MNFYKLYKNYREKRKTRKRQKKFARKGKGPKPTKYKDNDNNDYEKAVSVDLNDPRLDYNVKSSYKHNLADRVVKCKRIENTAKWLTDDALSFHELMQPGGIDRRERERNKEITRILSEMDEKVLDKDYKPTNNKITNAKIWNTNCHKAYKDLEKYRDYTNEVFDIGVPMKTRSARGSRKKKQRKKRRTIARRNFPRVPFSSLKIIWLGELDKNRMKIRYLVMLDDRNNYILTSDRKIQLYDYKKWFGFGRRLVPVKKMDAVEFMNIIAQDMSEIPPTAVGRKSRKKKTRKQRGGDYNGEMPPQRNTYFKRNDGTICFVSNPDTRGETIAITEYGNPGNWWIVSYRDFKQYFTKIDNPQSGTGRKKKTHKMKGGLIDVFPLHMVEEFDQQRIYRHPQSNAIIARLNHLWFDIMTPEVREMIIGNPWIMRGLIRHVLREFGDDDGRKSRKKKTRRKKKKNKRKTIKR